MAVPLFSIVASSVKRFNEDKCWTSAIVISYFTFLCAIPLIALAAYVTARVLGSSEIVFRDERPPEPEQPQVGDAHPEAPDLG